MGAGPAVSGESGASRSCFRAVAQVRSGESSAPVAPRRRALTPGPGRTGPPESRWDSRPWPEKTQVSCHWGLASGQPGQPQSCPSEGQSLHAPRPLRETEGLGLLCEARAARAEQGFRTRGMLRVTWADQPDPKHTSLSPWHPRSHWGTASHLVNSNSTSSNARSAPLVPGLVLARDLAPQWGQIPPPKRQSWDPDLILSNTKTRAPR